MRDGFKANFVSDKYCDSRKYNSFCSRLSTIADWLYYKLDQINSTLSTIFETFGREPIPCEIWAKTAK